MILYQYYGKSQRRNGRLEEIKTSISDPISKRALEASIEVGASSWLTTLPLKKYGFSLDKQSFWDGLYIRYNIPLKRLPTHCVCGMPFKLDHALSCPKGGFISIRHNEVRDFTTDLLAECCKDVSKEPTLQQLTGEELPKSTIQSNEARVDVAARGFWIKGQVAYFDVKVFINPTAKVYLSQSLKAAHHSNEQKKKRSYNKRILNVDQGSFTPLSFGGMSRECATFYNRLAECIAEKRNENIEKIKSWIRCKINFCLLRVQVMCIRGTRNHHFKNRKQ